MAKFTVDAPKRKVIKSRKTPGIYTCSGTGTHCDGPRERRWDLYSSDITQPSQLKSSTLRTICTQAGISRDDFLRAYERV